MSKKKIPNNPIYTGFKSGSTNCDLKSYNDVVESFHAPDNLIDKRLENDSIEKYSPNPENIDNEIETIDCYNIAVNSIGSEEFVLKKTITVTVENRDDEFTACLYEANIFGYGDNIQEAIDDLIVILVETFEFLQEQKHSSLKFGKSIEKQFIILNDLIEKRH